MLGGSADALVGSGPPVHAKFKLPLPRSGAARSGTSSGVWFFWGPIFLILGWE